MSRVLDLWAGMTGTVLDFAGLTPPEGWIFANGATLDRDEYPDLFRALTREFTADTLSGSNVISPIAPSPETFGMVEGMYVEIPGIAGVNQIASLSGTAANVGTNATVTDTGVKGRVGAFPFTATTFNLPDYRGRVGAGRDDMGGTAANRLTTAGSGVNGVRLGANGGAQTHTLTESQMPAHTHTSTRYAGTGGSGGTPVTGTGAVAAFGNVTSSSTGGGQAHQNTQPTIICNKIIKT